MEGSNGALTAEMFSLGNKQDTSSSDAIYPMTQSSKSPSGPKLKAMVAIVIVAFAGLGAFFFLTTETSCTYQTTPSGPSHIGMQTYWEKLVGGLCHPLPTQSPS